MTATGLTVTPTMVRRLARHFGTPLYVYDAAAIDRAVRELGAQLPAGARLYYSVKANPLPEIAARMRSHGLPLELSSTGEVQTAAAATALDGAMVTGPGKSRAEYRAAIGSGVRKFSVESATDHGNLERAAAECATAVDYLVRVNAPAQGRAAMRMSGRPSQFGVDPETFDSDTPLLRGGRFARFRGLHFFPASNVVDESELLTSFRVSAAAARGLVDRYRLTMLELDLGGGFAAPFGTASPRHHYPRLAAELTRILNEQLPGPRDGRLTVSFESGRYLVGGAGVLVTAVRDIKRSHGKSFAILDAGINHLGGMAATGRILPSRFEPTRVGSISTAPSAGSAAPFAGTLAGPLCTPADILVPDAAFDELAVDDLLAIPNVGAYGLTAGLTDFLGHPAPAEILLDGDRIVSATRRSATRISLPPLPPRQTMTDPAAVPEELPRIGESN